MCTDSGVTCLTHLFAPHPAPQVVRREVAEDPARTQRCCQATAKTDYRLNDGDLKVRLCTRVVVCEVTSCAAVELDALVGNERVVTETNVDERQCK